MNTTSTHPFGPAACRIILSLLASTFAYAQSYPAPPQSPAASGGWRRVGDPPPPDEAPYPQDRQQDRNDARAQEPYRPPNDAPNYMAPPQLIIRPGTFITVRVNQPLSSDHNQPGDAFSATLVRPLVVDGVVVAQRGQIIGGRVAEANRAGRVEGVSRLSIQLTDLTLVDGQQIPIQSQLISRAGPTSVGQDTATIAGTTAMGAAIGAAADWGRGAAIGAAAGAVAGAIGVLTTRGHATVIYPESVLTFRIEGPVTIVTDRAPQAFRYVDPNEYDRPYEAAVQTGRPQSPCGAYGCAPPPPPPYYYRPYYPYPYYYGPSVSFFFGSRYYGPRYYRYRR